MATIAGPTFNLVEEISWEELERGGGFSPRKMPLLIKGAVKMWPAWQRWSFDSLSQLRRPDGSDVVFRFQNGLVEQGVTSQPLDLPIPPYLRELAQAAEQAKSTWRDDVGLVPDRRWKQLREGERF